MAGNATDYLEMAVLHHTLGMAAMPAVVAVYIGLCTTAPTDATQGTEVVGGGYTRQQVSFADKVGGGAVSSTATIEYPQATANWGTIGWVELWTAPTGGNRLYWLPLVDPGDLVTPVTRTIQNGDIMRIPGGSLVVGAD